ncbi:MAG: hypothetical protein ACF8CQ_15585 [Rhodopirellula sp. JB044]|uniref:hypothetical protein n=1 Tax=Rhodopirellula sp. JB044 TaxID=3342844 RepID=UPI00370C7875
MFRTEYAVHLRYAKGMALFSREEQLPFAPFVGLDVLDNVLGEFKLEHVAWHAGSSMFLCQGTVNRNYWNLRQAQQAMKKAGWTEEPEAREPN